VTRRPPILHGQWYNAAVRRLGRYILNSLTALSLLLLIAICVLWILSYRRGDLIEHNDLDEPFRQWRCWQAWSRHGSIRFANRFSDLTACSKDAQVTGWPDGWKFYRCSPSILGLEPWDALRGHHNLFSAYRGQPEPVGWYRYGLGYFHGTYVYESNWAGQSDDFRFWLVPYWALALSTLVLPVGWIPLLWRFRRSRIRRERGLCPHCGYDIRASPEICPECGADHGAAYRRVRDQRGKMLEQTARLTTRIADR
jgi:hypothetical protein